MALEKKAIRYKILSYTDTTNEHLFKLILFPHIVREHNGWKESVAKSFNVVSRLYWSGNNYFLSQGFYFKHFFEEPLLPFDKVAFKFVRDIRLDYKNLKPKYNECNFPYALYEDRFKDFYNETSKWLAEDSYDKLKLYALVDNVFGV